MLEKIKPYKHKPIKPSDEWQKIDKLVKQAQAQFLQIRPGELSPAAKAILAHDYTPEGRAVKELMESIDSEEAK